MNRLELFKRTLDAWLKYYQDSSTQRGNTDDVMFLDVSDYLKLLIQIEQRLNTGILKVAPEEVRILNSWKPSGAGMGPLTGTAVHDISNAELSNLLCDTQLAAEILRKEVTKKRWFFI